VIKLLDADTVNITRTFTGHEDPVNTAVLSPDRQVLLTASGYAGRRSRWMDMRDFTHIQLRKRGSLLSGRDIIGLV
jgi:WD40 repeat protein